MISKKEFFEQIVKELNLDVSDPFTLLMANAFALADLCEALQKRGDDLAADAQRWQTLMGVSRIRLLGYARHGRDGTAGPIRHIGFEFTDGQEPYTLEELELGKRTLLEFVDGLIVTGGSDGHRT